MSDIKTPNPTNLCIGRLIRSGDAYGAFLSRHDGGKDIKSNPLPTFRMFDCSEYEDCLDMAINQKWKSWKCHECPFADKAELDNPPQASDSSSRPL